MTAESPALVRAFPVGKFRCVVTIQKPTFGRQTAAVTEWWPYQPKRLTDDEIQQYRDGRDAALAELGSVIGGAVMVVEV